MKKILFIIGIFCIINTVSSIYPGETIKTDLSSELNEYYYYVISGNTSMINVTVENLQALIYIPTDANVQNFSVVFNGAKENRTRFVTIIYGSSCMYNQSFDWNCSVWSECIDLKQNRTCKKYNNCGNTYGKPEEWRNCTIAGGGIPIEPIIPPEEPPKESWFNKYKWWILSSLFILFLIIIFIIYKVIKKRIKTKDASNIQSTTETSDKCRSL